MAVTGNLYPFILQQTQRGALPLSFLTERYTDVESWRAETREYLHSLLLFNPPVVDLSPERVDLVEYPDYIQEKWYITSSPGERVPLILLIPRGVEGPAPAVLALHGHGSMYYFGKKQLVEEENEPQLLAQFRQDNYDGVAIANALVRRGFVVAIIDSFYFGERRMIVPPTPELQPEFLLVPEGSDQWVELVNRLSERMEDVVAKSLTWAGVTWPGILAWDDMRTVDFLLTRPEVDAARLGCVGLSMGGMRAALLGALDPRVKAVCVVGWMTTLAEMLEEKVARHAWCNFIPGLTKVLDWPDVAGLHAPDPLFVMQGNEDTHFPLEGFQKAAERLRAIYAKAAAPGNLDIRLFDVARRFTLDMQCHAWAFLDQAFGIERPEEEETEEDEG